MPCICIYVYPGYLIDSRSRDVSFVLSSIAVLANETPPGRIEILDFLGMWTLCTHPGHLTNFPLPCVELILLDMKFNEERGLEQVG